ncbi:hypothetical protein K438DRAFT_1785845 [Mycena galopus ATCC 62051]|nr:hypothetical protein K438DRAFT_1785845 [Mycena galopus ATCC 62051]
MPRQAGESQTVNICGGTGGNGGTGGVSGGGGGAGEGPRTTLKYDIRTESFTINNNFYHDQPPLDFCRVNLGDLNLLDEINQESVVERCPIYHRRTGAVVQHISTRRVHRARIFGHQDLMTVIKAQVIEAQRHQYAIPPHLNLNLAVQSSFLGTAIWVYWFSWAECIDLS